MAHSLTTVAPDRADVVLGADCSAKVSLNGRSDDGYNSNNISSPTTLNKDNNSPLEAI
jgi:hypothetical protein